ncbi:hypothetical protein L6164_021934 [Bauhinia variegata]|uniref:Uncharacterized protein n=1 Tax=Bauhinia variegata TaxID=167791 RepID=A0ACB9ME11_BAUVA|nr:hypothetical protein L6164_021934 [Bauhinia variegata]
MLLKTNLILYETTNPYWPSSVPHCFAASLCLFIYTCLFPIESDSFLSPGNSLSEVVFEVPLGHVVPIITVTKSVLVGQGALN